MTATIPTAGPVQVRLIGAPPDVARLMALLEQTTQITSSTDPWQIGVPGQVVVHATVLRRFPLTGGEH